METETTEKTQILTDKDLIKVLLVEDDEVDKQLVKRLLVKYPQPIEFAIESVNRLSTAIEYLGSRNYDIILLDLGLPDSRGIETVRRVSEINPHIPIVVLTGLDDEETGLLAIKNGATDYLVKGLPLDNLLVRTVLYALERKQVEERIKQAAQEWMITFDSITDMISIHDKNFKIVRVNKAFAKTCKTEPKELVGRYCYEVMHGTKEPHPVCPFRETLGTKKPSLIEFFEPHLGIYLQVSISPIFDDKGEVMGCVHVARDITERKKAEDQLNALAEKLELSNRELQTNKASFHNIVEKSADGIVVVDGDGIMKFVNLAAESLFGHKAEELLGELFGFPVAGGEVVELDVVRHGKEPGIAEMRVVETEWNGQGAYLAMLRDVTDRKKAEEKLKETMKMKSEFISMVSHELRTPLTAIKEGIALVADGLAGEINEEQKELLGISKKNVDRLARLINDVLDFQKLDSAKMNFNLKPNDINQIVNDTYDIMASTAKNIGLDLLLELGQNLPKAKFDSDKITQALTNLVTNAMKFTEKGNVTIKTTKTEDAVQVSVSDTGCGIKKEDLPKVFNRFEQLGHGGERKTGGTGLGLAISKEIIERHGGRICVESKPGKGSKFAFTLPVYSTKGLLKKYINDGIREASKNDAKMSLVCVSIGDFDKLKQKLSHKKINSALKGIETLLVNNVRLSSHRAVDAIFKLSNEVFIVLANCNKENTLGVKERFEQILDDYLAHQNLADKIKLLFGGATYPDDAITSDELIKKAKELRPMVPTELTLPHDQRGQPGAGSRRSR